MTFIVEALSWGTDLVAPDLDRSEEGDLDTAKMVMDRYWADPKCFHVQLLSPSHSSDRLKYDLHCMRSRPTTDRELRLFFEKVTAPAGVRTIQKGEKVKVLRVRDFSLPRTTPAGLLQLPAHKFLYEVGGCVEEINHPNALAPGLSYHDFETCLAAAAFMPDGMDIVLGVDDDWWDYLSEVDVNDGAAILKFSRMKAGRDFVQ